MVSHIVVSEGLAYTEEQKKIKCSLSDYFQAVLDQVINDVPSHEPVFISPANNFGCDLSEEEYAYEYLLNNRKDLKVYFSTNIKNIKDVVYLDTFDNARILRIWLEKENVWNLGEVNLYCNKPHCLRSFIMFRLCGFKVKRVIGCSPKQIKQKIVPRLWFYDYPMIQIFYESFAILYDLCRWLKWKIINNNSI